MAYVPRGAPKGKKSKEVFHEVEADYVDADAIDMAGLEIVAGATKTTVDSTLDLEILLPGHAATDLFTVQDDASHNLLKVNGTGVVSATVGGLVTKKGSGADVLIATLTTAFGDPAGLADGSIFIYVETTSNPDVVYLVMVYGGAFYLQALTAAAAA